LSKHFRLNIMYLRTFLSVIFVVISTVCIAQQSNHLKLLNEKKALCETIMGSFSGKNEAIEGLIKEGKAGLKIATDKDHEYRLIFNNAVATGFYYKQDFKSAKQYFEAAYEEAVKAKLVEKSLKPLGNLVSIYHYLGLQNKADSAAQKLKQIADATDTLKYKTDVYYNLGLYNQQQKFYYGIALSNFLKSVELHKPIVDTTKILKRKLDYGSKLMMVAEIYIFLKQPKKALEYLNEATPYLNLSVVIDVAAYGKFIRCYVLLGDKKQALKYYNLLHSAVGTKPGKWSELVSSNLEIATLALREKDFKLAKSYIDKADKQARLDNSELLISGVNLLYGDYYKSTNNYIEASKYYKIAEPNSAKYSKEEYADLLKSLTAVEIALGDKKTAENYFNKYVAVSDSLNQRKISLNLAEMEAKFQNEFKQQKIGVLNEENEAKTAQLKQEKTTRFLLMGGAALLLIALFSIYLNFRNKQKANLLLDKKNKQLDILNEQLTGANETKAKLFSIISHDLRSPVSQLFTFLKLQTSSNSISEEEKHKHQKKLMESSSALLSTMEDLLMWSKSQMEHFQLDIDRVDIKQLFDDTTSLMQNQAEAKNLSLEVKDIRISDLQSDQNLLTIVLRNLLQNAINHSYPDTKIYLNAAFNVQGKPIISIINHGAIITEEKIEELLHTSNLKSKTSGYGLLIVKELLQKLNANLQIESTAEATTISVVFAD
jgi:signal transduction histidine kinase